MTAHDASDDARIEAIAATFTDLTDRFRDMGPGFPIARQILTTLAAYTDENGVWTPPPGQIQMQVLGGLLELEKRVAALEERLREI